MLFQERLHVNHYIFERLKNSIKQLKTMILESMPPDTTYITYTIFMKICVRYRLI